MCLYALPSRVSVEPDRKWRRTGKVVPGQALAWNRPFRSLSYGPYRSDVKLQAKEIDSARERANGAMALQNYWLDAA